MAEFDPVILVGPAISLVLGIATTILGIYVARRNGKAADGNVSVAKQNANTTTFDTIRLGWESSMADMRQTIIENREEAAEDIRKLTQRLDAEAKAKQAILDHLTVLEALVPFPPGPPPRPIWAI